MLFSNVGLLVLGLLPRSALCIDQSQGFIANDSVALHSMPPADKKAVDKPRASLIPNAYIIQLESQGSVSKHASDLIEAFHSFVSRNSSIDYSVRQTFSSESIFVGLSLIINSGDVNTLKGIENVVGVWNIGFVSSPSGTIRHIPLAQRYSKFAVAGTNYSLPYITGDLDSIYHRRPRCRQTSSHDWR